MADDAFRFSKELRRLVEFVMQQDRVWVAFERVEEHERYGVRIIGEVLAAGPLKAGDLQNAPRRGGALNVWEDQSSGERGRIVNAMYRSLRRAVADRRAGRGLTVEEHLAQEASETDNLETEAE